MEMGANPLDRPHLESSPRQLTAQGLINYVKREEQTSYPTQ